MGMLQEVEYEKIFSPKTMAALKGKSAASLKQMLGKKDLMKTIVRSQELLDQIIEAESDYHVELAMIAEIMVKEAYPVIEYNDIKIDAKIVTSQGEMNIPKDEDETPVNDDGGEEIPEDKKRRIINGITQGASVRGTFGFLLFKEYLDDLNPSLVEKYNEIMKLVFGIYDNESAIAMMLSALSQGQQIGGGSSEMVYDEEKEQFIIKARALCFPMLLHEIVKGLYEIVGTEGFDTDKEKNQSIINRVDKVSNEPRDFQYGKFIYDGISNLYNENNISDARVRELLFAEVYKLEDIKFFPFIENMINDELTPIQKKWATDTMKEIESDLKKDDLPFNV